MSSGHIENREGSRVPALFSFITFREEPFGAIVFNPFLPVEVELDEFEAQVVRMCDGAHSLDDVRNILRKSAGYNSPSSTAILQTTFHKLDHACAVQYLDSPRTPKRRSVHSVCDRRQSLSSSFSAFSAPKSVIWDVTYACNLSCQHCLTDSGNGRTTALGTEEAHELIDRLADARVLYVSLTGGEPFLHHDILDLVAYITDRNMRVDIASNGFDVPKRVLERLRELPVFQVQVSVDGIGASHDRFRGKKGAFERACQTLSRLKEEGFSTSISTTTTAQNIGELPQIIDLAVSLGCDAFKAIPFIPAGRGRRTVQDLLLSRRGSMQLSRILAEKEQELRGRLSISTETTFTFLLSPQDCGEGMSGPMTCSAGYDELSVGADGTAYPCPFLHDFPLGNLLESPMEKIWLESPLLNEMRTRDKESMTGPCRTCRFAPLHCRGGCRAAAYLTGEGLNGSDPLCFKDFVEELHRTDVSRDEL